MQGTWLTIPMTYIEIIITGLFVFTFLAAIFTLPYIAYQYRKHGSVSKFRTMIIYSFILYLLISYLMVVLPLPELESTIGNKWQEHLNLIPFRQIWNYWHAKPFTFKQVLVYMKSFSLWQLLFNILLTVPFGMYLRYYFKLGFVKTTVLSFCLSLFFELTQISALYGIYPGPYRLADVEDLICNTLGGVIGYQIAYVFIKFLPAKASINERCVSRQIRVSGLRRFWAIVFDIIGCYFCFAFIFGVLEFLLLRNVDACKDFIAFFFWTAVLIISLIQVLITGGGTLGHVLCRIMIVSADGGWASKKQLCLRYLFLWLFTDCPILIASLLSNLFNDIPGVIIIVLNVVSYVYFAIYIVNVLFRKNTFMMPHDKLSGTVYAANAVKGNRG